MKHWWINVLPHYVAHLDPCHYSWKYSSHPSSPSNPRESILGRTANSVDVISIRKRCEKQKILLLSALQYDPRYARNQDSTRSLIIYRLSSQSMEDLSVPRVDEQGGEVASLQPVEGEIDSRKFRSGLC